MKIDTEHSPRISCPRCFVEGATEVRVVPHYGRCHANPPHTENRCQEPTVSIVAMIVGGKLHIMEVCEEHRGKVANDELEHKGCGPMKLPESWVVDENLGLTIIGQVSPDHTGRTPREEAEREYLEILREGYELAVAKFRQFAKAEGVMSADEASTIEIACRVVEGREP